eukprot:TRINITY_DN15712_c0_g1_i10.p1 TRINITY_DN15712_c0_g1~~TRINITY_DN15712_c0_g1_i10.p1  ORF type:complete len:588 (+),score=73.37 TRINITY_DN15712_c0_g1_i10:130-1893(+)
MEQGSRPTLADFVIVKQLGEGSVGIVFKVIHTVSGNLYALKRISKKLVVEKELGEQLLLEVRTQLTVAHDNLLRCYDYFEDEDFVYLVLDYAPCADLYRLLRKEGPLSESDAAHVFAQVAGAIRYLHERGMVHRDLKPENVLLCEGLTVKVCDFGWCAQSTDGRTTFCGTLCMLAPEMIAGKPYDAGIDIWALGVLLFEMLAGFSPFDRGQGLLDTCENILYRGLTDELLREVPAAAHGLLKGLLQKTASMRLSLDAALVDPWVLENSRTAQSPTPAQPSVEKEAGSGPEGVLPNGGRPSRYLLSQQPPNSSGEGAIHPEETNTEVPASQAPSSQNAVVPPTAVLVVPQMQQRAGADRTAPRAGYRSHALDGLARLDVAAADSAEQAEPTTNTSPSPERRGCVMSIQPSSQDGPPRTSEDVQEAGVSLSVTSCPATQKNVTIVSYDAASPGGCTMPRTRLKLHEDVDSSFRSGSRQAFPDADPRTQQRSPGQMSESAKRGDVQLPVVARPAAPKAKTQSRHLLYQSAGSKPRSDRSPKETATGQAQSPSQMLEGLLGLGFTRLQSEEALRRTSSVEAAVEWILQNNC